MTVYASFDVSDKACAVHVVEPDGREVWRGVCATDPEEMAKALRRHARGLVRVVMETGPLAVYLYHELVERGVPVVCICARHAKKALSAMNHKSDPNDALMLAHLSRTGFFKPVHIKKDATYMARASLKILDLLGGQFVALRNQLRGSLKQFGLRLGVVTTIAKLHERLGHLFKQRPDLQPVMAPLIAMIDVLSAEIKKLKRMLGAMAGDDPVTQRLMSVPGVGPITALTYKTSVEDPDRFRRGKDAAAFFGLVPRRDQSGKRDFMGRITKAGDPLGRSALYEAANSLISRVKQSSPLRDWGLMLATKVGAKRARVAVARKLAILLHRLWQSQTSFDATCGTQICAA
jgi:transposase